MTDKEKIIAYIDKLLEKYPKNYYLLMVAEFINSLQEEPIVSDKLSTILDEALSKETKEPWDERLDKGELNPKFKVGDIVRKKNDGLEAYVVSVDNSTYTVMCDDWTEMIIDNQWELVERPKFKVGQSIIPKSHTEEPLEITDITHGRYYNLDLHICDIKDQDRWETVPVSKIWHNVKEPPKFDRIVVFRYIDGIKSCGYNGQTMKGVLSWAYYDDIVKL